MNDIEKSCEQYHHLGTEVRTASLSAPKEQLFPSLKAHHAQHVSASRLLTSSDLLLRSKPDTQPLVITVTSNTESTPTGPVFRLWQSCTRGPPRNPQPFLTFDSLLGETWGQWRAIWERNPMSPSKTITCFKIITQDL